MPKEPHGSDMRPWYATAGQYMDGDADPELVAADLEGILLTVHEHAAALATSASYCQQFGIELDDTNALVMAEKEANSRYQVGLWEVLH